MFIPSWRATLDWLKGIIGHSALLLKSGWCFNYIITKPCWIKQKYYCSFCNITDHCICCWRVPISCKVIPLYVFLERFPGEETHKIIVGSQLWVQHNCWNYKFSLFLHWGNSPETYFSKEFGIGSHKSLLAYAEGFLSFHTLSALL